MWQIVPLSEQALASATEDLFDDGSFPAAKAAKTAATEALKEQMEHVAPFLEGSEPHCHSTVINYGRLIDDWFAKLSTEEVLPNPQQMAMLQAVNNRVLLEQIFAK